MSERATVQAIYIAPAAGAAMVSLDAVSATAGEGLEGDRYAIGAGHYSKIEGWGAQVTLIQSEAIDAVNIGHGADFTGDMLRRNILTSGIQLKKLIGCEFRCGGVVFKGTKLFPPCMRLARLLGRRDVIQYFSHCAGIGAEVIQGGKMCVEDDIELLGA